MLTLLVALTTQLTAQETIAGRTFLSLGGGMTFGPGELWTLRPHAIINPNLRPAAGAPPFVDSLVLTESVNAGSAFLFSVTKYPSNNIGIGADFSYAGLHSSQDCSMVFDSADDPRNGSDPDGVSSPNRAACQDIRSRKRDALTFDIVPFVAWRVKNGQITPILKAGAGLSLGPCTVRVRSALHELVDAPCSNSKRPTFSGTIGLYRQTDVESQFHFELRYSLHRWDVLDGTPGLDGIGNSRTSWRGAFGFSMGVDFQI